MASKPKKPDAGGLNPSDEEEPLGAPPAASQMIDADDVDVTDVTDITDEDETEERGEERGPDARPGEKPAR